MTEGELRADGGSIGFPQRYGGGEGHGEAGGIESGAIGEDGEGVGLAAVIEGGTTLDAETELAPNAAETAVNAAREGETTAQGHEVQELDDAFGIEEAGDENVGGGPVELLAADGGIDRGEAEAATFGVIEDGAEEAGGIDVGMAEPIDGAVDAAEGDGAHVADDAVVFDGLVHARGVWLGFGGGRGGGWGRDL